jgi:hypothetical protein
MDEKYCLLSGTPKTIQSSKTTFIMKTVPFKKISLHVSTNKSSSGETVTEMYKGRQN